VKNTVSSVKNNIISRYVLRDETLVESKTANINVLLNRVKLSKKRESRNKLLFSAATFACVLMFSFLIF
jgi:hypothetical protein